MQDNLPSKEYKDLFKKGSYSENHGCQSTMTLEGRWSNSPYRVWSVQRILCVGTIFQILYSPIKLRPL